MFENEEWLILKPLTYESSVKYGYGTTWCTAMVNDRSYFNKYSKGILIYVLNKKDKNIKYAVFKSIDETELSFWSSTDKKFMDSIMTGLPGFILAEISTDLTNNKKSNWDLNTDNIKPAVAVAVEEVISPSGNFINPFLPNPPVQPLQTFMDNAHLRRIHGIINFTK